MRNNRGLFVRHRVQAETVTTPAGVGCSGSQEHPREGREEFLASSEKRTVQRGQEKAKCSCNADR